MSDAILVAIITGLFGLAGAIIASVISAKTTRTELLHKLDTNQQLMNARMDTMQSELSEVKVDVKSHNNYARLFNEAVPVLREQYKEASKNIEDMKLDIRELRKANNG